MSALDLLGVEIDLNAEIETLSTAQKQIVAIARALVCDPRLLILDEAWLFLGDTGFAAKIRAWLKTLRKRRVAVVFATQSLADITESSIAPAIIESCPQRILLPNDRAIEPHSRAAYARFGAREIEHGA